MPATLVHIPYSELILLVDTINFLSLFSVFCVDVCLFVF